MTDKKRAPLSASSSYWKVFRLIFVIFSLYLLRDGFNRWDGFRYHSTFAEFIPSVALVTVFWGLTAVVTALIIWLIVRGIERLCHRNSWKISGDFFLMFLAVLALLAVFAWTGKRIFLKESLSSVSKSVVLIFLFLAASLLSWRYRNKFDVAHERITPLVWLFIIWSMISLPIVIYHTWLKQSVNTALPINGKISTAGTSRPNIILVIFDALTARDMSVYGYGRETTPFIDGWSKSATTFKRVKSSSNWTTSSMASLMTGKRVWTHKTFQEYSAPLRSDVENLPLLLKNNGYYNIAYVVNHYASPKRLGISESFDLVPHFLEFFKSEHLVGWRGEMNVVLTRLFEDKIKFYSWIIDPEFIFGKIMRAVYFKFIAIYLTEVPPEIAFNKFLKTLDGGVKQPFFAWIHLFPPHDPYLPPEPYSGMFDDSPRLRSYNQQSKELLQEKISNQQDWEVFKTRYDEFIRYCDKTFGDFVGDLSRKGKLKNTIIIFTSDHGESFEHGDFTHGHDHLYEQVTHIPLIIKEPDQTRGIIVKDLVEQIDITPTILDLAKIPVPSWVEGRSSLPLLRGEINHSKPAFSMNFKKNPGKGRQITQGTVAVWEGDYKLIHYIGEDKSLLFNLKEDPDEMNDLFDKEGIFGRHLLSLVQENLKRINSRIQEERSDGKK